MNFTGERFIPGIFGTQIALEHWHRYRAVAQYCKDKIVIDIASGEGYGSNHLAQYAAHVTGFDIDQAAVVHAHNKYQRDNLTYQIGSVTQIPVLDHSVDVVVSFETIEHIDEEAQKKFLQEVVRVLKKDGLFIVSTPDKLYHSDRKNYQNEFHIKEFYKEEFQTFLEKYFPNIFFGYQQVYSTSILKSDSECALEVYAIEKHQDKLIPIESPVDEFEYIIALCSQSKLPELSSSVNIDISNSLASEYLTRNNSKYIQLFIDTGDGFSEGQSLHEPFLGTAEVIFDLSKFDSIVALRLDPLNDFTIVSVDPMEVIDDDNNRIVIETNENNAVNIHGDCYEFLTNDPQIVYKIDNSCIASIKQAKFNIEFHAVADEAISLIRNKFQQYIYEQQTLLNEKDAFLSIREREIKDNLSAIKTLEDKIVDKDTFISDQQALLSEKDELLSIREREIGENLSVIKILEDKIADKDTRISEQQALLSEKDDSIVLLRKQVITERDRITGLKTSLSWKVTRPLRFIEKHINKY